MADCLITRKGGLPAVTFTSWSMASNYAWVDIADYEAGAIYIVSCSAVNGTEFYRKSMKIDADGTITTDTGYGTISFRIDSGKIQMYHGSNISFAGIISKIR